MTTKNIVIKKLRGTDIPVFYSMLNKEFFGSDEINSIREFENLLKTRTAVFGFYEDEECRGGAYIQQHDKDCYCSIAISRKSIHPEKTRQLVNELTDHVFQNFDVRMVYSEIKVTNTACMKLIKAVGWVVTNVRQKADGWYAIAGIIRERFYDESHNAVRSCA